MTIPSDTEIMACDEYIQLSDESNDELWAAEYSQASWYAHLTWGGSVARHIHTDAVARIEKERGPNE